MEALWNEGAEHSCEPEQLTKNSGSGVQWLLNVLAPYFSAQNSDSQITTLHAGEQETPL